MGVQSNTGTQMLKTVLRAILQTTAYCPGFEKKTLATCIYQKFVTVRVTEGLFPLQINENNKMQHKQAAQTLD